MRQDEVNDVADPGIELHHIRNLLATEPQSPDDLMPAPARTQDTRPVIDIRTGELGPLVDACEEAMLRAGTPFYARGGQLVRPVEAPREAGSIERPAGALILAPVTPANAMEAMEGAARFQRWTCGDEPKPRKVNAPQLACRALLDRGTWAFKPLRGIAQAPFIRSDGSVACRPGYDDASGMLLAIPGNWPAPPEHPSRADALQALEVLRQLIRTFPFASPADESVTVAAMLSLFVRASIEAAPMFGFSAPAAGSGKSLIADVLAIMATGSYATMMTWGHDDAENGKALTAALMAGDAVVVLDNVDAPLRGELLCSSQTQASLRLRPLGRSELVTIPCVATFVATGNALTLAGDMTRRALVAELDPKCERPELRQFANDPKADALASRTTLVNACLSIITAGVRANFDRPAPLGSYGQWSRLVRDPLVWLGMPDPVSVMERTYSMDPEREGAIGLLGAWRERFGAQSVTAAEAIKTAATNAGLLDALDGISPRPGAMTSRGLGRWLRRHEGRVLAGLKVQSAGGSAVHGIRWRVVEHA